MDIKKVSSFESLVQPEKAGNQGKLQNPPGAPSFADTLNGLQNKMPQSVKSGGLPNAAQQAQEAIKFSNHAVERMQTRGISFNKTDLERLNEAVSKAANKGSKDTLVLMNDSALIVSVKNKTVVTVMDQAALKENVFTNIDSTIVM
jgi:flagellar operon protein